MNLDLDTITTIGEENRKDCILCKHNVEYLTHIQDSLVSTTSIGNMYEVMYNVFTHRMDMLKEQNLKYIEITYDKFCDHFENHILNLRRIITSDIRIVQQIQTQLLQNTITKNGLNAAAVNTWIRLSNHKCTCETLFPMRTNLMSLISINIITDCIYEHKGFYSG